jgi:hypothetical protein
MSTPAALRARSPVLHLVITLALILPLLLLPASRADAAATPYCDVPWGSLPKNGSAVGDLDVPGHDLGGVAGVRAGRHACFDRLVVDLDQPGTHWFVSYVDKVRSGGSGFVVPTAGGARLQVSVGAPAYSVDEVTGDIVVPYQPAHLSRVVGVGGFDTFRQVTYAGAFEGQHEFGLGVRARLPFRVFHLEGPGDGSRLVVDVAHRWR